MNLYELYSAHPSNYMIFSENGGTQFSGGVGKTSQALYFVHEICGKEVNGKIVIPIYIKMSELNLKSIGPEIIFEYFYAYFNNGVTKKAILEMIQKAKNYLFVVVADGLNEVNNYVLESGQTVYNYIANNFKELGCNENVHIIITSRMKIDLFKNDEFGNTFREKCLLALDKKQYREFLQMEEILPEPLERICENPMLLGMFKKIYEMNRELALSLQSRYELMKECSKLDTEYKKDSRWSDNLEPVREYVICEVLPRIGYAEEKTLLTKKGNLSDSFEETYLDDILEECEIPDTMNEKLIRNVIQIIGLLDDKFMFRHELFREYFAVQGLKKGKDIKQFFEELNKYTKYNSANGMEYEKRTRFMDFCEFLYATEKDKLKIFLEQQNLREDALWIAETFYYNLVGLYKDLGYGQLAVEVGKIAIRLLEELEERNEISETMAASYYNYLGFSMNADPNSLQYLERAKKILKEIGEDVSVVEKQLMGKILSNFGAHYFGKNEFSKALELHQKALTYRIQENLTDDVYNSYRTIMSDYYHLGKYEEAYANYLNAKRTMDSDFIDLELEERAMGSEIELLKNGSFEIVTEKELTDLLRKQILVVYDGATNLPRKNLKLLESLNRKLTDLQKTGFMVECVGEYKKKIEEIIC